MIFHRQFMQKWNELKDPSLVNDFPGQQLLGMSGFLGFPEGTTLECLQVLCVATRPKT